MERGNPFKYQRVVKTTLWYQRKEKPIPILWYQWKDETHIFPLVQVSMEKETHTYPLVSIERGNPYLSFGINGKRKPIPILWYQWKEETHSWVVRR